MPSIQPYPTRHIPRQAGGACKAPSQFEEVAAGADLAQTGMGVFWCKPDGAGQCSSVQCVQEVWRASSPGRHRPLHSKTLMDNRCRIRTLQAQTFLASTSAWKVWKGKKCVKVSRVTMHSSLD